MLTQEIRAMDAEEIAEAVTNARKELFNLRFQRALGQLSDTSRVRNVKRDLARLLTVQREIEIWKAHEASQAEATGEGA